jgi:hypothetical protein
MKKSVDVYLPDPEQPSSADARQASSWDMKLKSYTNEGRIS